MNSFRLLFIVCLLAGCVTISESCRRSSAKDTGYISVNPAFKEYVEGFTSGHISKESDILVRLNFDVADSSMIDREVDATLFTFKPAIKGNAFWTDSRTIKFVPDETLPSQTSFEAHFQLSRLINVPDSLKTMVFGFQTISQDFEVFAGHSRAYNAQDFSKEYLTGHILTADAEELSNIKNLISAQQEGVSLEISWSQEADKRKHSFRIENIKRDSQSTRVAILYNGSPIGVQKKGTLNNVIPGINEFKMTDIETSRFPEKVIRIRFSDPLKEDQEMDGRITLGKFFNYSYVINFNELNIYPASELNESEFLNITSGIVNVNGKKLDKSYSERLVFKDITPDIRFIQPGTILPSANGQIIPFEAVNLKAVDVRIIKIFQKNIPQFLQINELSGNNQITRVGKTVVRKTIPLGQVANVNSWNRYVLDVSQLIQAEPGAIYRVELSIKKEYSTLLCEDAVQSKSDVFAPYNVAEIENDDDNWEYYSDWDYYDDDDYYYYWYERNDPCANSYYYGKKVSTNILASDIGLTVKAGDNSEYVIIASNLIDAQPMRDVKVELLSYQLQTLGSGVTDNSGICRIKSDRKPYLIIAEKDKQQSYLRISDGNSLSVSSFDVSGETLQRGMKGFIYGERGVWRPGDSLFLTFILEEKNNMIAQQHPVIFELYNPQGNLIEKRPVTTSVNGFYSFHTATSPDAPTGTYRLIARVGKNTFSHSLKIETIKPNRLKIEVNPGSKVISLSNPQEMKITSEWLHGAAAKQLKVETDIAYRNTVTTFSGYKKYMFDDPARRFSSDRILLYSGRLDDNGSVTFKPDLQIHEAPGFVQGNIETRIYEPGGEFSIDFMSVNISPYKSYAGIMKPEISDKSPYLFTNRQYTFGVANVTEDGKAIQNGTVQLEIYKLDWRYWWSNYSNDYSDFMYSSDVQLVENSDINIRNGLGTFTFKVENDDWGKYYMKVKDPESGHSGGFIAFFDWYGYNRFADNDKTSAAMLTLSTDKTTYKIGEEIKLTCKAPKNSRAYLTIENSSGIIQIHQINERDNLIEFKIKATVDMTPNVYFSVTLLQPHENTIDGLPIRLYGVVPVFVENPETKLQPVIASTDIFRPGQTATISVSETSGKPMTYTLAIVDEGLLSLTKFKTPDPHARFYSREALGVKTWDVFTDVIGAWGGKIQRILSIGGGDEVETDPSGQRANRFKPMVRFVGPLTLARGKSNSHKIEIPDYVGSVRIMVVAGQNSAYGHAQKNVTVRNPLMLLGTAPRVIGPGETFRLPVNVFAMENHVKKVTLNIQTNSLFTVSGSKSRTLTFNTTGDQLADFELNVADVIGVGQLMITAVSGNERAVWKTEIDVRPSNPEITNIIEASINKGEVWDNEFSSVGVHGTNSNTLEISSFIPMNIDKWLSYLLNYPHGCVEQTISGAFPMLYAEQLSETSEAARKSADAKIKSAISRIQNQQLGSGAFAMWPGARFEDEWTTSYAGHFLIEAKQMGYVVSKQCLSKWTTYQQRKARNWRRDRSIYNNDLMQAYRLYTLALSGTPENGAMNRLSELAYLSPQSKWLLASSYAITGRNDLAKQLIAKTTTVINPYYEYAYTYGSHIRDKAFILETFLRLGMKNEALSILKEIAGELGNNNWLSTQTAGQSLRAVAIYLKTFPAGKQMLFNITHKNSSQNYETKNMTHFVNLGSDKQDRITIKNNGTGTLYVRLIRRGIPKESELPPVQNNLGLKVQYTGLDGTPINIENIEQGTVFYSTVTITHPGTLTSYNSMALTQIFPSGWEVMNDRFAFENESEQSFTYQDIRDDRVLTYFHLGKSKTVTVRVRLSASYAGTFYMPMIWCEAMYNNRVSASLPGKWVRVSRIGENSMSDARER
jgi:alpha-2-macroglobulin